MVTTQLNIIVVYQSGLVVHRHDINWLGQMSWAESSFRSPWIAHGVAIRHRPTFCTKPPTFWRYHWYTTSSGEIYLGLSCCHSEFTSKQTKDINMYDRDSSCDWPTKQSSWVAELPFGILLLFNSYGSYGIWSIYRWVIMTYHTYKSWWLSIAVSNHQRPRDSSSPPHLPWQPLEHQVSAYPCISNTCVWTTLSTK